MVVNKDKSLGILYPDVALEWDYDANFPITPFDVTAHSAKKVQWCCVNGHKWETKIYNRVNGTACPYCAGKLPITGVNDLATLFPELKSEWDYSANSPLTPQTITAHTRKKVSWKCMRGHKWKSAVVDRTNGSRCPYCSGKLPIQGETDLYTCNPEVAQEWDYKANYPLTPHDVSAHSTRKVKWQCKNQHRWAAEVNSRTKGRGCPYCAGSLPIIGETDLATVFPEVANQWDYEANAPLTPSDVTAHSDKRIHWKCQKGHKWVATINNRSKGKGCPYCANQIPTVGENDLQTLCPDLVNEWDFIRNDPYSPQNYTIFSHKQVWWHCSNGHSWRARISNRSSGNKCPYCTGKLPVVGSTDLATTHPNVAIQWDYEKNKKLTPQTVSAHAGKHIWWLCDKCNHSWRTTVSNRVNGSGCPKCNGRTM